MPALPGDLIGWSWTFMGLYIGLMLLIGILSRRRIHNADDFATARGGYGPLFLAFAFAATSASGATFMGIPGIAYSTGLSAIWILMLYPVGLGVGVMLCMKLVMRSGNRFGSRSIPEYLGDRYQSDSLRLIVALFSLLLFFYLAGQLVSCLVMFQTMLGLAPGPALIITCVVLAIYVAAGGAHADILTDGLQGMLMIALAMLILALFLMGYGVENGLPGLVERLRADDPQLVGVLNAESALTASWWAVLSLALSTIPMGLLPHLGNKLWALQQPQQQRQFVRWVFILGLIMPTIGLGGLLARALFGDELLTSGTGANEAIPALFLTLFPTWIAALFGAGVLAAIMSTADGLVISSSQVIANDLYRRSIAPRWHGHRSAADIEATTLSVSRWATGATLLISAALAWKFMSMNVLLIVWIGLGGMMAALAGPLVLGSLWRGVTRAGALTGFVGGAVGFIVLHAGVLQPHWFGSGMFASAVTWLQAQAPNPYSCTVLGEIIGVTSCFVVSLLTTPLPDAHLDSLFPQNV